MRKGTELYCNRCGKQIQIEQEIRKEDILHVEKTWGYFSNKDGEKHIFDLCEECYDKWIQAFQISIEVDEEHELL